MTDLLPCPFCGNPAVDGTKYGETIGCPLCEIWLETSESWNRRAAPVQPAGLRERALKIVRVIWSQFYKGYFGDVECQEQIVEALLDLYHPDAPTPQADLSGGFKPLPFLKPTPQVKRWRCTRCGREFVNQAYHHYYNRSGETAKECGPVVEEAQKAEL